MKREPSTKRHLLLAAAVLAPLTATLFFWRAPAQENSAVSIPILNPRFDIDVLSCSPGNLCYPPSGSGITGWICGPETNAQKMSTVQYPDAPPEGLYVVSIGYTYATGSILQTLGATVQANTTYTLTLNVGARADVPFTGYLASLGAGNVTLASGNKVTPVGGTFAREVIVYNSGANPAQLGQPLQIFVKSLGTGQVNISAVSLTAQPTS